MSSIIGAINLPFDPKYLNDRMSQKHGMCSLFLRTSPKIEFAQGWSRSEFHKFELKLGVTIQVFTNIPNT